MNFSQTLGGIRTEEQFDRLAVEAFRYQLQRNEIYAEFVDALGVHASTVTRHDRIPFLPIEFFKSREVYASEEEPSMVFRSSGTTGMERSSHAIADPALYRASLLAGFRLVYGDPSDYLICALTPSPEENPNSSLAFMIDTWIRAGAKEGSGFYLNDMKGLAEILQMPDAGYQMPDKNEAFPVSTSGIRYPASGILFIGLTYALLDFAGKFPVPLPGAVIMETGGMKGTRREMVKEELHGILAKAFSVKSIHSEYGMSELLTQAYSTGNGRFFTPPWMKVLIRDPNDPLSWNPVGKSGGISVIDLANWYSCPFIATQDLGRLNSDGSFEVLGRFDHSDLRGCNLMIRD